jgi:hypothetical protein
MLSFPPFTILVGIVFGGQFKTTIAFCARYRSALTPLAPQLYNHRIDVWSLGMRKWIFITLAVISLVALSVVSCAENQPVSNLPNGSAPITTPTTTPLNEITPALSTDNTPHTPDKPSATIHVVKVYTEAG